jgi:hypothetical protein
MGIARMIERGGELANLPFPIHAHMLRHSTGYALAANTFALMRISGAGGKRFRSDTSNL